MNPDTKTDVLTDPHGQTGETTLRGESPVTVLDLTAAERDNVTDVTSTTGDGNGLDPEVRPAPARINPVVSIALAIGIVSFAVRSGNTRTLLVALAFGAMIMLHEAGHFVTARLTGMKATEFFVGFGPRIWSFKRGETEYGIKALPLGGYVKILGMHNLDKIEDPADEPRTYRQQSYPKRLLVASAGTLTHLVLALVLLTAVYSGFGESVDVDGQLRIGAVITTLDGKPSPAAAAGIQPGEWLLAVNGTALSDLPLQTVNGRQESTADAVARIINGSPGTPLRVTIGEDRTHTSRELTLTPVEVYGIGRLGLAQLDASTVLEPVSIPVGIGKASKQIVELAPKTFQALGEFFTPSHIKSYSKVVVNAGKPDATEPIGDNRFLSPIGAVRTVEQTSGIDYRRGLELFAYINVFVGVFNMMPTLPFDGGHVVIATYERLRSTRRKRYFVDVAKLMPVVYVVMFLLMAIGLSSLYLDVRNPV